MGLADGIAWEREFGSQERRPMLAAQQCIAPAWKSMESAPQEVGVELIAARFGFYDGLTSMCEKSPFVTFWMKGRQKFYGNPTHWLCKVPESFPTA